MSPELDKQLCEAYPKIFVNRHGDPTTTAMCWGFDHDDGWYNIIDMMCGEIQARIDSVNKYNEWAIENHKPIQEEVPQVVAVQVKEKFGTLRFYYDGGDEYIRGVVAMGETMSCVTCEQCGKPGKTIGKGWLRTLCDEHSFQHHSV